MDVGTINPVGSMDEMKLGPLMAGDRVLYGREYQTKSYRIA